MKLFKWYEDRRSKILTLALEQTGDKYTILTYYSDKKEFEVWKNIGAWGTPSLTDKSLKKYFKSMPKKSSEKIV